MKLGVIKLKSHLANYILYQLILLLTIIILCKNSTTKEKISETNYINKIKYISPFNVLYPNSTIPTKSKFQYANGPCSNEINCFIPFGICVNETTCMCMPEYAQVYIQEYSLKDLSCSYKKKSRVVAGLLELFLPFGLGHFYAGHLIFGTVKFFYNFLVYTFCCVIYCKGPNNDSLGDSMIFCVFLCCIIPIWNIIDIFLFF